MRSAWKAIVAGFVGSLVMCTAHSQQAPDNAIRNADGSRTILRSQQLPEANERHARWCTQHGGIDITNQGDLTLGPNTVDAVVCQRVDPGPGFAGAYIPKEKGQTTISPDIKIEKAPSIMPSSAPAWTPQQLKEQSNKSPGPAEEPMARAGPPTISIYPNNGYNVYVGELFYAAAYAIFRDFPTNTQGRVNMRVPALGCAWTWQALIDTNPKQVDGFTGCVASYPGVIRTTIQACAGFACANGEGSFVAIRRR